MSECKTLIKIRVRNKTSHELLESIMIQARVISLCALSKKGNHRPNRREDIRAFVGGIRANFSSINKLTQDLGQYLT